MTLPSVRRFSHQAMGTYFEIFIAGEDESYAGQAAQAAFREIDRLEGQFSRFDPASEIGRLSRLGPGERLPIGLETFECLTLAELIRGETNGAFDVNWKRTSGAASPLELHRTAAGFEARVLDSGDKILRPLDLDLGAIGKGYALDRALEILREWSIANALVHGGTSTAIGIGSSSWGEEQLPSIGSCSSPPDGSVAPPAGWPVGVGGGWPCESAPREILLTDGRALSGSGTEVKGRHILDPRTGAPAAGHLATWTLHVSAAAADALSTAFMVMDTDAVEDYCRRHPDVWALVIKAYGDGRMFGPPPPSPPCQNAGQSIY
jgi:thiamine biosynthesis lipoprotein